MEYQNNIPILFSTCISIAEKTFPRVSDICTYNNGLYYILDDLLVYPNDVKFRIDPGAIGLVYCKGPIIVYPNRLVFENQMTLSIAIKSNLTIYNEMGSYRVMNGKSVHFAGMFQSSYSFPDMVISFDLRSHFEQSYRVFTLSEDLLLTCHISIDDNCKFTQTFTKQATQIGQIKDYIIIEVKLIRKIKYIINFATNFCCMIDYIPIDIYQNGQNIIIEGDEKSQITQFGRNYCQIISDSDVYSLKNANIKSARKL